MKLHILRLTPGQEVKSSLEAYVTREAPNGVVILTCCGSLTSATLRMAANDDHVTNKIVTFDEHFEVLAMSGTISAAGTHLHICLSDNNGATLGGHVMGNLKVFTTMEVGLGQPLSLSLTRPHDLKTGFDELKVTKLALPTSSSPLAMQ
ncbi:hypothetical protein SK128_015316 [Halocaridina rubra]|uniref:PPC domain-containing protein n=1 Tax=Halocaridina rubra TaxID=373956 RepID=A0AAN8XIM2_HALRR